MEELIDEILYKINPDYCFYCYYLLMDNRRDTKGPFCNVLTEDGKVNPFGCEYKDDEVYKCKYYKPLEENNRC